ncbi:D-arabitol-phosphate dehydrogenase [Nocardioides aquaticus]|uniref:D-arabitol-phosphate dehydrogenase n=1 Tax=Nocardioides aquaticus TaxID=160826 RepID=A0ABX8ECE9_9ACTN|nr:zinc-binding dehydrogenase [Nocardioides aquaticus]QVT78118.1 D-arabitol-phosphate dehydrogenase [Nocardioides aquaticus]
MRAVSCAHGELEVVDLPDPRPAAGQVVLAVRRCGICGSDLHAKDHADELDEVMVEVGYDASIRSDRPTVLGHEICGEVVERGRGVPRELRPGTLAVTFPLVRAAGAVHLTGLSPQAPGGYAEQVLAQGSMTLAVPNGLAPEVAVLTEPMAVALHAVRRADVGRRDVAVVLGCGPVGLAVVCHLKARGVRRVVASDPSAARRALALRCGADTVVDPREESPYDAASTRRTVRTAPQLLELAVGSMDRLRRVPGWVHLYRAAELAGAADAPRPVVFECVGTPGMIDGVLSGAPMGTRVVVVGVCMGADRIRPSMAVNKEIELRFVLGYTPLELRDTLHLLAEGEVDASPLVTGTVGLDGVAGAFVALAGAERHAKVLVDPSSDAVL